MNRLPISSANHRRLQRIVLLLWLFGCLPSPILADALSELPPAWQGELQAIAETDLSGAEAQARQAIRDQRAELARLISDAATSKIDLAEGYGRLGALYQVFQVDAAAQASYQNAMQLDPGNFRWAYYAAYHASRMGQHAEALRGYRIAQRLRPDYPPLTLRMAVSWLELNRLDEATQALQSLLDRPGLRTAALYHLAQIDLLQRNFSAAIEKFEEVLRLDPQADQAHYPLAQALRAQGENARAREHLASQGRRLPRAEDPLIRELEALNRGARRLFNQGLQATQRQDFRAAAEAFAQGLEVEPGNPNARVSYARALFLNADKAGATRELEAVLRQQPNQELALFLSAILREQAGDTQAATTGYRRVLELDPEHYGAHFCLANQFYREGEYNTAVTHYQAALRSNPEIPPARLYELLARKLSGAPDAEILSDLETLLEAHPQDQILRYIRIRLLLLSKDAQLRDRERARQQANELVQQAFIPPHVELQALVAAAIGNFEQAVTLQQQILPSLQWLGPEARQQAQQVLASYREEKMPEAVWYKDDRMLQPPVTDARLMFREYPAAVPF